MPTAPKQHRAHTRAQSEKQWASRQNGNHALYNLWIWRKPGGIRDQVLWRDPLCVECEKQGRLTPSTQADHIRQHNGDMDLFIDMDNLQGLCAACHSRKTMREECGRGGGLRL